MLKLRINWYKAQVLSKKLSRTAANILKHLCYQNFSGNISYFRNKTIAQELNMSVRTCQRGMKELIQKGCIIRERRYLNGSEKSSKTRLEIDQAFIDDYLHKNPVDAFIYSIPKSKTTYKPKSVDKLLQELPKNKKASDTLSYHINNKDIYKYNNINNLYSRDRGVQKNYNNYIKPNYPWIKPRPDVKKSSIETVTAAFLSLPKTVQPKRIIKLSANALKNDLKTQGEDFNQPAGTPLLYENDAHKLKFEANNGYFKRRLE